MKTHHIFCLIGKSASGKDTIYQELLGDASLRLHRIVPYTTRPVREGEVNGREYFFTDIPGYEKMEKEGRVIEHRVYPSVYGPWYYFTADDGQIDLSRGNFLMIGTLESFRAMRDYFGEDVVIPLYIHVEDGERLTRALQREKQQDQPRYTEMCRRFLADAEDFSDRKIEEAGIRHIFDNTGLSDCMDEIREYIRRQ